MSETQVKFSELAHFSPKQKEAKEAVYKYKYTLYGGAMGGGKSYFARWILVLLLMRWAKQGHKNVVVGLFCEDYPALKDRHISKVEKEFPSWLGDLHADHKSYGRSYILKPEYGSGVIAFRNLDDPSKYQSSEFAAIDVDEITKNPEETMQDLRTRLRWPGIVDVKFIGETNPGGIGHAWVKKKWIDKNDDTETELDQFYYVKAMAVDNPHLDSGYMKTLESLPEDKRRAFLEGDWDIFKGQYFSEWRKDIHVCAPFNIPLHWKRYLSGDYGFTKPSAIYWNAVDEDGVIYVYRELYKTGLTYEQLMEEVISMTPFQELERILYLVMDPAIWSKKDSPVSGYDKMVKKMHEITKVSFNIIQANNDRVNGWGVMREYLKPFNKNDKLMANLQVLSTCTELIRTLPSLIYDKFKVEDLDSDGEDHAADAVRYGIMSRPPKTEKESGLKNLGFIPTRNYDSFNGNNSFE